MPDDIASDVAQQELDSACCSLPALRCKPSTLERVCIQHVCRSWPRRVPVCHHSPPPSSASRNMNPQKQSLHTLLPGVVSLTLYRHELMQIDSADIPDMTDSTSISSLSLPDHGLDSVAAWRALPPNLTHLTCNAIGVGPPANAGAQNLLLSLSSVLLARRRIRLPALAQLLRVLPSLQNMTIGRPRGSPSQPPLTIRCIVSSAPPQT